MLRIQHEQRSEGTVTLVLQGRLEAEWTELLESECAASSRAGLRVDLDLSDVVFIARSGFEALARLGRSGIRCSACSPLVAAMLAQEGIKTRNQSVLGRKEELS